MGRTGLWARPNPFKSSILPRFVLGFSPPSPFPHTSLLPLITMADADRFWTAYPFLLRVQGISKPGDTGKMEGPSSIGGDDGAMSTAEMFLLRNPASPSSSSFSHRQSSSSRKLRAPPYPPQASHRRGPNSTAIPFFYKEAATGYAAALLDAARCGGGAAAMERDVQRFSWRVRAVMADPLVGEEAKAAAVRRAAEEGGFCRQLVALVRMLVGKGKVGLVGKVMEEFERIHDELTGARIVLVSPAEKMSRSVD